MGGRRPEVRFALESRHSPERSVCPFSADFVAEIGIQTARDGWCIFLKPSIVTRWIVRATYARLY
jgi:hypothetical protein